MSRLGLMLAAALLAFLESGAQAFANAAVGVVVDTASIRQASDEEGRFVISGRMVNSLSVRTINIRVKLSILNAEGSEIRSWETRPKAIAARGDNIFVFRIRPIEFKDAANFLLVVSEYELDHADVSMALSLADETHPAVLRAVIKTLVKEAHLHPAQVTEAFKSADSLGRLCLSEAVLVSGQASSFQLLAEQLLSGQYSVDQQRLQQANQLARQLPEPEPFPLLAQWQISGDLTADIRNLLRLSRSGGLATMVRMSVAGTLPESRLFAREALHSGNMEDIDYQLSASDRASRLELKQVYRELAQEFPNDPRYRRAIGMTDWCLNRMFIGLVLAAAFAIPVIAVILGIREKRERKPRKTNRHRLLYNLFKRPL